MVRRDRNHPSVFGWSFGNELFAIFEYNHLSPEDSATAYDRLSALASSVREADPTRAWISCDGDEDLHGSLPVWSKHFGHGLPLDRLPQTGKPLMVGESGGTYYAKPSQLAEFNGERAYQSYAARNEALGIDVYQNIAKMARPRLAYYSASELAWFGLESTSRSATATAPACPTSATGSSSPPMPRACPGCSRNASPLIAERSTPASIPRCRSTARWRCSTR